MVSTPYTTPQIAPNCSGEQWMIRAQVLQRPLCAIGIRSNIRQPSAREVDDGWQAVTSGEDGHGPGMMTVGQCDDQRGDHV